MLMYTFFHISPSCHKKTVGDGEKLLTCLNSVLKVLSGLDIFPRGTKKSEILLTSVIILLRKQYTDTTC
jgi:hypothetical protein